MVSDQNLAICILQKCTHPYLRILYTNLTRLNCKIRSISPRLLIFHLLRDKYCRIIHLHWIEHIFRHKSYFRTFIRGIKFIIEFFFIKYVMRKRLVFTIHNLFPHERIHPYLENWFFRVVLSLSNAIIAHNNYTKIVLTKYYKLDSKKIHVIPHGNFIHYYPSNMSKDQARKKLGIPNDKIVILFLGAIRRYKGLEDLLHVLDKILSLTDNFYIMICGKPMDQKLANIIINFCKRHSNKCLTMLKFIPDEEIQLYINASDVGIIPYKQVTTSGSALLFLSFGKPVIVPNLLPLREQIGDAGIYYKPDDINSLRKVIESLSELDLEELSRNALKKALEYDWNTIAVKTCKLYYTLFK